MFRLGYMVDLQPLMLVHADLLLLINLTIGFSQLRVLRDYSGSLHRLFGGHGVVVELWLLMVMENKLCLMMTVDD